MRENVERWKNHEWRMSSGKGQDVHQQQHSFRVEADADRREDWSFTELQGLTTNDEA